MRVSWHHHTRQRQRVQQPHRLTALEQYVRLGELMLDELVKSRMGAK